MPQFDPTYFASQIFWLIVCFSMLVAVMSGVIVPRIQGGINRRSQFLQDLKDREASYLQQIDLLTKQMERFQHVHAEKLHHQLEEAHREMAMERDIELRKISAHFTHLQRDMRENIEKEVRELRKQIPSLAQTIAKNLAQQMIEPSTTKGQEKRHVLS